MKHKQIIKLNENQLTRIIREGIKRVLRENVETDAESLCYGRDDLMRVAESVAAELGNIDIAEDLCNKMALAAVEFVKYLQDGGTFSVTRY